MQASYRCLCGRTRIPRPCRGPSDGSGLRRGTTAARTLDHAGSGEMDGDALVSGRSGESDRSDADLRNSDSSSGSSADAASSDSDAELAESAMLPAPGQPLPDDGGLAAWLADHPAVLAFAALRAQVCKVVT